MISWSTSIIILLPLICLVCLHVLFHVSHVCTVLIHSTNTGSYKPIIFLPYISNLNILYPIIYRIQLYDLLNSSITFKGCSYFVSLVCHYAHFIRTSKS